jgi:tetratricopeptide (TPR) repeat protein
VRARRSPPQSVAESLPLSAIRRFLQEAHRRGLWQVFGIFLGGGWGLLQVLDLFIERGFVPEWVFGGAFLALLAGLPVILTTAYVQGGRGVGLLASLGEVDDEEASKGAEPAHEMGRRSGAHDAAIADVSEVGDPKAPASESTMAQLFTWRRAIGGGVLAFALLGVVNAGYLVMRVTGIGAPGTLVAQGVFEVGGQVVLADFESSAGEEISGDLVTEALRIDLAQSPTLELMPNSVANAALDRMQRSPSDGLPEAVALELAAREGVEGVISGEVGRLGSSVVITARLLAAGSGDELASFRVTAEEEDDIIEAIDELSRRMREKVGESLRSVAQSEPLAQVSTSSLEALKRYSAASLGLDRGLVSVPVALRMFQEAVEIDSTFAAGHRAIAVTIGNSGGDRELAARATEAAYRHRLRLPEQERLFTEAYYHMHTGSDMEAARAFRSLLVLEPEAVGAAGNLTHILSWAGRYEEAVEVASGMRGWENPAFTWNLMVSLAALGDYDEANAALDSLEAELPGLPYLTGTRALLLTMSGKADSAWTLLESVDPASDPSTLVWERYVRAVIHTRWGQLDAAAGMLDEAERTAGEALAPSQELFSGLATPWTLGLVEGDTAAAAADIEDLHRAVGWEELSDYNKELGFHALTWAVLGYADRAEEMLERFGGVASYADAFGRDTSAQAAAFVAILRGQPDGVGLLESAAGGAWCARCSDLVLGFGYERAEAADQAIDAYERYLRYPFFDAAPPLLHNFSPVVHERLGGLYEARGDSTEAAEHYRAFAEAWANADGDLMPRVRDARARAEALGGR